MTRTTSIVVVGGGPAGAATALESAHDAAQSILKQSNYAAACERLWGNYLLEREDYYRAELR